MRAVVLVLLLLAAPALAQRPGHLGKPPARARAERQVVPKWPRKPDPHPLATRQYVDVRLQLQGGKLTVLGVEKGTFSAATQIKRFRGRFEVRLYAAGLLLDVIRFDFPLTGAAESQDRSASTNLGDRLGLGLAKGVSARTTVRIPFNERVRRVVVHDSLTRKQIPVSLDKVSPPPPRPTLPADLRTRSFGPAAPAAPATKDKKLEDSKVLKTAPPKKPKKEAGK